MAHGRSSYWISFWPILSIAFLSLLKVHPLLSSQLLLFFIVEITAPRALGTPRFPPIFLGSFNKYVCRLPSQLLIYKVYDFLHSHNLHLCLTCKSIQGYTLQALLLETAISLYLSISLPDCLLVSFCKIFSSLLNQSFSSHVPQVFWSFLVHCVPLVLFLSLQYWICDYN